VIVTLVPLNEGGLARLSELFTVGWALKTPDLTVSNTGRPSSYR